MSDNTLTHEHHWQGEPGSFGGIVTLIYFSCECGAEWIKWEVPDG